MGFKRQKREKAMAASITKQVEKRLSDLTIKVKPTVPEEPSHDEARAYIMSLIEGTGAQTATKPKKVTLKSILAKSKN